MQLEFKMLIVVNLLSFKCLQFVAFNKRVQNNPQERERGTAGFSAG